jgi:hypothetical protein
MRMSFQDLNCDNSSPGSPKLPNVAENQSEQYERSRIETPIQTVMTIIGPRISKSTPCGGE